MGARGTSIPSRHHCAWVDFRAGRLRLPHSFFMPTMKQKSPTSIKVWGFLFVLAGLQLDVLGAYI